MMLASMLGTPISFSATLVRSNILREAGEAVLSLGNPFDVDRMLAARFSHYGSVIAHPMPDTFRRMHPCQDSVNFDLNEQKMHMTNTTKWILDHSPVGQADVLSALINRLSRCPEHGLLRLRRYLHQPWCAPCLQNLLGPFDLPPRWQEENIIRRSLRISKMWFKYNFKVK